MDIEEIKKKKTRLEDSLLRVIHAQVEDFSEKTGVAVSGISVDLSDVTEVGSRERQYEVTRVRVYLDI